MGGIENGHCFGRRGGDRDIMSMSGKLMSSTSADEDGEVTRPNQNKRVV